MKNHIINEMLKNGVHLGHKKKCLNKTMREYVLDVKSGVSVIDLEKTKNLLKDFLKIINNLIKFNKIILFICTKKKYRKLIEISSKSINMPYVNRRWFGGMLTNFVNYKNSLKRYNHLINNFKFTKKHNLKKKILNKNYKRSKILKKFLEGTKNLNKLPDAIFIIDPLKHKVAIKEANIMNIPVFCLVDTNCENENIDYSIPWNDDSLKSIYLFLKILIKNIKES